MKCKFILFLPGYLKAQESGNRGAWPALRELGVYGLGWRRRDGLRLMHDIWPEAGPHPLLNFSFTIGIDSR